MVPYSQRGEGKNTVEFVSVFFFYSLFSELRLNSKTQYIYLMQVHHPNFREIMKGETVSRSPELFYS